MPRTSSGLLMYRLRNGHAEFLLAHPGGPYWRHKDDAAWTLPKGEVAPNEDFLDAAKREFHEETGLTPTAPFLPLKPVKQKAGKIVHAWAFEGDCNCATLTSNTYKVEWPPKSGQWQSFPEIDRADFFNLETALKKINPAQAAFLRELAEHLSGP